jgi:hypothetical protein
MSRASSQFAVERVVATKYARRVVIALIVIGVIAFLAVDALVFFKVFKGRAAADDYGMFMVPGKTTVTVPAGKLKISYQEEYKADNIDEDTIDFGVPGQLQVKVTNDATGEEMAIKGPGFHGMGEHLDVGTTHGGWSRARVGTIEITQPGRYTVSAQPAIENGVEPKILIGK